MPLIFVSSCSSKNFLQPALPPRRMRSISLALKASMEILLTKEMCTPSPRWTPAHDRQMKMPNLGDAHCGDGALQSQQTPFLDSFWRAASYRDGGQYMPKRRDASEGNAERAERRRLTLDRVSGSTSHMALDAMVVWLSTKRSGCGVRVLREYLVCWRLQEAPCAGYVAPAAALGEVEGYV